MNYLLIVAMWIKYVFTIFRAAPDIVECRLLINCSMSSNECFSLLRLLVKLIVSTNLLIVANESALDIVECRLLILAEEACGLLACKRLENGLTKIIDFDKKVFIC